MKGKGPQAPPQPVDRIHLHLDEGEVKIEISGPVEASPELMMLLHKTREGVVELGL